MDAYGQICELLGKISNSTLNIEQRFISGSAYKDISVNDMHIIEAIGLNCSRSMSLTAKRMGVTVGTLTIAINGLVKKGYVTRMRSEADRRVVLISLSEKGIKALHFHEGFHKKLKDMMRESLDETQCALLAEALEKVEAQFKKA